MMDNDFEHYYNATIRLKRENAELKARIADIKEDRLTYYAYCGEEFSIDAEGTPDAVSNHIHNCPKHPIQDYKTEIADLKEAVKVEIKEAMWDSEALNELLRQKTGMGQGEIDSETEDIKEVLKSKYKI